MCRRAFLRRPLAQRRGGGEAAEHSQLLAWWKTAETVLCAADMQLLACNYSTCNYMQLLAWWKTAETVLCAAAMLVEPIICMNPSSSCGCASSPAQRRGGHMAKIVACARACVQTA